MKLTILFLMLGLIAVSAESYSQSQRLNLSMKDASIVDIFNEIEQQSDFYFFFKNDEVKGISNIDVNYENETIDKVLVKLLQNSGLKYKMVDKYIVISPDGSENLMTQNTIKLSGKVTDNTGQPLPGVTIVVKGTTNGTISNFDGIYTLSDVPSDGIIQFSFVGMKMQEIPVGGNTSIDVTMEEDAIGIEEVVAIGYGVQKKVNLTGAVSSVKFDELSESRPITTVSSALSGLSSGVTIRQNDGMPGSDGATIRIRGIGTLNNSNPLVIIDGIEGNMDYLNPQDIESISILKDAASASIYGSRAANGVILITTKSGKNKDLNVNYNANFSVAQPVNMLNFVSNYPTYMRLMNESARNIGTAEIFSENTISLWEEANKNPNAFTENGVPNYVAFPNTDWNDALYQNNLVQNHNISINGATDKARFLLSAGYLDNPGLVNNTGFKRYSIRSNVEIDVTNWLTVGTRTFGMMDDKDLGSYDKVLDYAYQQTPGTYPFYDGMYGFPEAPEERQQAANVLANLNENIGDDKKFNINTTLYSKVKIAKGLFWDFNFNYTKNFTEHNQRYNPVAKARVKFSTGDILASPTPPEDIRINYNASSNYRYTLENLLRYEKHFNEKHNLSALLGYSETYFFSQKFGAAKEGLIDQDIYVFDAATEMISIGGSASDWALRSYFGRVNYNFEERYLFEANLRYDGSSRFAEESRYGLFPSFSLGWRLSEEGFMKNLGLFDNLKVRASWGKLGNNASGNYAYQAAYSTAQYVFNGIQAVGLYPQKIANNQLQWESTTVTNLGIDASILNKKLTAELDFYNKITDGILTSPPIYLTLGLIGAPTLNTAEVTNKGVDLTLGWRDKIGDIKYSVQGNIGYNHNRVTGYKGKLITEWRTDEDGNEIYYSNLGDVSSGGNTRVLEDHQINEYYLFDVYTGTQNYFNSDGSVNINGGPSDGMIRTEQDMEWLSAMTAEGYQFAPNQNIANNKLWYGDLIYADSNGDGIYGNSYDKNFTGKSKMPKISFGTQINVSWKNFDLSMIWSGQAGVSIYWLENGYNSSSTTLGYGIGELVENDHYYYNGNDFSDPENNISATYPRLKFNQSDGQNNRPSTRWLYNGAFLRLKNMTLGYSLPKRIANKVSTKNVRLFFSAENLLTFTSFPGLDPEMGGNVNYPIIRQISFGTNITF